MPRPKSNEKHLILALLNEAGSLSPSQIATRLTSLTLAKIQRNLYVLQNCGAIEKTGDTHRASQYGRPESIYRPLKTSLYPFESTLPETQLMPIKTFRDGKGAPIGHRFLDDKVDLLQRLMKHTYDRDRDTLIGILADYGVRVTA